MADYATWLAAMETRLAAAFHQEATMDRDRVKVFYLPEKDLLSVLSSKMRVEVAWPFDATIVAVNHELGRRAFAILVQHESFAPIPPGEMPPTATIRRYYGPSPIGELLRTSPTVISEIPGVSAEELIAAGALRGHRAGVPLPAANACDASNMLPLHGVRDEVISAAAIASAPESLVRPSTISGVCDDGEVDVGEHMGQQICPDCHGSRMYHGLAYSEDCRTCHGQGFLFKRIARAASEPHLGPS